MATTKVLIVKPVENLGGEGEQVAVKAGYARNYLFPKKIAIPVNKANKKQIEALIKARELREARELENAQSLAKVLAEMSIAFAVKTGEGGKLFGSVTSKEISDALHEQFDLTIEKQKIVQAEPIKSFGAYEVKCKLGYEVTGTIHVLVIEEK